MKDRVVDAVFALYQRGGPEWWRMLLFRVAVTIWGRHNMIQAVRNVNEMRRRERSK